MATTRNDWRKLMNHFSLVLVLPSLLAILVDFWLGLFPLVTIVAILICFPTAGFLLNRVTLQEMDRVINEIAPVPPPEVEDGIDRS